MSKEKNCDLEVCLGDFCDRSDLTDEEISALREIKWNDIKKYFVVGNHESAQHELTFTTMQAIDNGNISIINRPTGIVIEDNTYYFIPYFIDSDRPSFKEMIDDMKVEPRGKKIVFSHNDIAGINYAGFISKSGFNKEEIESSCDLFLNGHLHNGQKISNKIYNLGSFSAHNFTNDSFNYKYGAWILDTDDMSLEFIENPFSLNFYKLNIIEESDLKQLSKIKNNSVLSIRYSTHLANELESELSKIKEKLIVTPRMMAIRETADAAEIKIQDLRSNHLERLVTFCRQALTNSDILEAELAELCK